MSKKDRETKTNAGKTTADFYKLHTKAVEDLVSADVSNSPEVSEEELNKYRSFPVIRLSERVKLLFIKFWFPAAVCYFFLWGLSPYIGGLLDLLIVTGIALGIVTDLLTNNAIRFFARTRGDNDGYMMFPKKSYITYPLNILYAWVILFLVFTAYNLLNGAIIAVTHQADTVPIGVEPVLFGLLYMGIDTLLIGAKHLLIRIFEDARKKAA